MINCNKTAYLDALSSADSRGTMSERQHLRAAAQGRFRYTEYGRQIALCTWLMVARADRRGKLALSRATLEEQHALVRQLRETCPGFFAGMLVDEDPVLVEAASAAE